MTFKVQPDKTRLFACQNPLHQGGGRKGLPKSFLNRFTQVITGFVLSLHFLKKSRGPFLESRGKFSRPKSHFKNHEALELQSFLFQQVLHLNKAYTYETFQN